MTHISDIKLNEFKSGYIVTWTERTNQTDWGNSKHFKGIDEAEIFMDKLKAREQSESRA